MEISSSRGLKSPQKLALGMKKFPYLKNGPFGNPIFKTKFENLKLQKRSYFTRPVPTALLPDRGEVIKIGDNFSNPFKTSLTCTTVRGGPQHFF
jgi:hypothetical protein